MNEKMFLIINALFERVIEMKMLNKLGDNDIIVVKTLEKVENIYIEDLADLCVKWMNTRGYFIQIDIVEGMEGADLFVLEIEDCVSYKKEHLNTSKSKVIFDAIETLIKDFK